MNITVFDALLVSLWAAVTALGARRGLGGAVWGVLGVAACFLVNLLAPNGLVGLVAALLLGVGAVAGRPADSSANRSPRPGTCWRAGWAASRWARCWSARSP